MDLSEEEWNEIEQLELKHYSQAQAPDNEDTNDEEVDEEAFILQIENEYKQKRQVLALSFTGLPVELFKNIAIMLPIKDLMKLRQVCKDLLTLVDAKENRVATFKILFFKSCFASSGNGTDNEASNSTSLAQLIMSSKSFSFNKFSMSSTPLVYNIHSVESMLSMLIPSAFLSSSGVMDNVYIIEEGIKQFGLTWEHNICSIFLLTILTFAMNQNTSGHTQLFTVTLLLRNFPKKFMCSYAELLEVIYFLLSGLSDYMNKLIVSQQSQVRNAIQLIQTAMFKIENPFVFVRRQEHEVHNKTLLTEEQHTILNHQIRPGEVVKIIAFAGTGKTTTLLEYAQRYPYKKILYIAFNKSVQQKAEKIFPKNVVAKTWHSMAYKWYMTSHKKAIGTLKAFNIITMFHNKGQDPGGSTTKRKRSTGSARQKQLSLAAATAILETVTNFLQSEDEAVNFEHVPRKVSKNNVHELSPEQVFRMAQMVYDAIKDPKNTDIPMTHDCYLKLYQLSKPKITGFDLIMLDEAQDVSRVEIAILKNQQNVGILLVGDEHQSIYGFRGAINAMKRFQVTRTFHLTQSFRFGFPVAQLANTLLNTFKKEKKIIIGTDQNTVIQEHLPDSLQGVTTEQDEWSQHKSYAYIARKNATLYDYAFDKLAVPNITFEFLGGMENYNASLIADVYHLYMEDKKTIKDPIVKRSNSFYDLQSQSENTKDEYYVACKIVERYGKKTMENLTQLIMRSNKNYTNPKTSKTSASTSPVKAQPSSINIILTTAHKAKGHEFDCVVVAPDFQYVENLQSILDEFKGRERINREQMTTLDTKLDSFLTEEVNLFYVTLTRAQKLLVVSGAERRLLRSLGCLDAECSIKRPALEQTSESTSTRRNVCVCGRPKPTRFTLTKAGEDLCMNCMFSPGVTNAAFLPPLLITLFHPEQDSAVTRPATSPLPKPAEHNFNFFIPGMDDEEEEDEVVPLPPRQARAPVIEIEDDESEQEEDSDFIAEEEEDEDYVPPGKEESPPSSPSSPETKRRGSPKYSSTSPKRKRT